MHADLTAGSLGGGRLILVPGVFDLPLSERLGKFILCMQI